MVKFFFETKFNLKERQKLKDWIKEVIDLEGKVWGEINYIFCKDDYLLEKNIKYLNHNTLTDIITFDYTVMDKISGDIFISVERIEENAELLGIDKREELHRVMIHGILHLCGYPDKSPAEERVMREKEDYCLSLRNF